MLNKEQPRCVCVYGTQSSVLVWFMFLTRSFVTTDNTVLHNRLQNRLVWTISNKLKNKYRTNLKKKNIIHGVFILNFFIEDDIRRTQISHGSTWICCPARSGDANSSWLTPEPSGAAKMTLLDVPSCLVRITFPPGEYSALARINCCFPGEEGSSAVTIWIFWPVCWSVTIFWKLKINPNISSSKVGVGGVDFCRNFRPSK